MRPMLRMFSPCPAIPTTSVAKINGTTSDLIMRRNTVPSGSMAIPTEGSHAPTATPTINDRTIARVRPMRMTLLAKGRLADAVQEVEHEPDHEPDGEAHPSLRRQAGHEVDAGGGATERDRPDERHPERPRAVWLLVPQHQYAEAYEDEREQRPDVGQVERLAGVTDQRPESNEQPGGDCRRPGRPILLVDARGPMGQQPIA